MSDRVGEKEQSDATSYTRSIRPDEGPIMAVVSSVAELTGSETTNLSPLYDAVDPDALERLTQDGSATRVQVEFDYDGYRVAVDHDRVRIQPLS
jgi:ATP-dependent DNA ligase